MRCPNVIFVAAGAALTCFSIVKVSDVFAYPQNERPYFNLAASDNLIIDFTRDDEAQHWRPINDGVMGGRSQGWVSYNQQATVFTGDISLANNGGFSSVYKAISPLPSGLDTVELDVEGDGYTYQARMAVYINGYRLAYKHEFDTTAGVREIISLPLKNFKASHHGYELEGAPQLKSEDIRQVGFLLTKKQSGAFALSLYKMRIYGVMKI